MPRSGFTEHRYTCVLCGDTFVAMGGDEPARDAVCMSCGLRFGPEKLKQLIRDKKKTP